MPANDDEILAQFTRVVDCGLEVELQVLLISWPQPHTPHSTWTAVARLPSHLEETEIVRNRRKLLDRLDYFGTCSLCSERKPAGWMHDHKVCQSCAEGTMGVVY
jgi:hypothetical protein